MADETDAEQKIEEQLRSRGWEEIDSVEPNSTGYISHEELDNGREPDYTLVLNGRRIAFIEAKRPQRMAKGAIQQAENYARMYGSEYNDMYGVPFVYVSNGDTYRVKDLRISGRGLRKVESVLTPNEAEREMNKDLDESLATFTEKTYEDIDSELWENQQEALEALRESIKRRDHKALVQMAPGTGKTRLAMAFIYQALMSNIAERVLILTDREDLRSDTVQDFRDYDPNGFQRLGDEYRVGTIDDFIQNPISTKVVIDNIQTLRERYEEFSELQPNTFDFVVVDEAHREISGEDRPQTLAVDYFDGIEIGLTATPDKKTLERYRNNLVYEYNYPTAVEDGIAAPFTPYTIRTDFTMNGVEYEEDGQMKTCPPSKIGMEVNLPNTNEEIIQALIDREEVDLGNELTIIYAQNTAHANNIRRDMLKVLKNELGVTDEFIKTCTSKDEHAEKILEDFKDKEKSPRIIVAVGKLRAGTDIVHLRNIVFMRAVGSKLTYNQMAGRGTRRPQDGAFRIYDCVGVFEHHKDSPLTSDTTDYEKTTKKQDGHTGKVEKRDPPKTIYKNDEIVRNRESYPAPEDHDEDFVDESKYRVLLRDRIRRSENVLKDELSDVETVNQFETVVKERMKIEDENFTEPYFSQCIPEDQTVLEFVHSAMDDSFEKHIQGCLNRIKQKRPLTPDQEEWVEEMSEYIIYNRKAIEKEDLTRREFMKLGGLTKAKEDFQGDLEEVINQLNNQVLRLG